MVYFQGAGLSCNYLKFLEVFKKKFQRTINWKQFWKQKRWSSVAAGLNPKLAWWLVVWLLGFSPHYCRVFTLQYKALWGNCFCDLMLDKCLCCAFPGTDQLPCLCPLTWSQRVPAQTEWTSGCRASRKPTTTNSKCSRSNTVQTTSSQVMWGRRVFNAMLHLRLLCGSPRLPVWRGKDGSGTQRWRFWACKLLHQPARLPLYRWDVNYTNVACC